MANARTMRALLIEYLGARLDDDAMGLARASIAGLSSRQVRDALKTFRKADAAAAAMKAYIDRNGGSV